MTFGGDDMGRFDDVARIVLGHEGGLVVVII
jgi:hypothetical protein